MKAQRTPPRRSAVHSSRERQFDVSLRLVKNPPCTSPKMRVARAAFTARAQRRYTAADSSNRRERATRRCEWRPQSAQHRIAAIRVTDREAQHSTSGSSRSRAELVEPAATSRARTAESGSRSAPGRARARRGSARSSPPRGAGPWEHKRGARRRSPEQRRKVPDGPFRCGSTDLLA